MATRTEFVVLGNMEIIFYVSRKPNSQSPNIQAPHTGRLTTCTDLGADVFLPSTSKVDLYISFA